MMTTQEKLQAILAIYGLGAPTPEPLDIRDEELRVPCGPTGPVAPGEHVHKCGSCETTWKHSEAVQCGTVQQFETAHSCPSCGAKQTWKYYGPGNPNNYGNDY